MLAAVVHSLYEMAWGVPFPRDSSSLMAPTAHEAALGALLGACVGDAAGVTLEFTSSDLIKRAAASSPFFTKCLALCGALCSHRMVSAIGIAAGHPLN